MSTHYETLNLPNPIATGTICSPDQIKKAYRSALLLHHPDKSALTTKSIDAITNAYRVLITPETRTVYDASLASSDAGRTQGLGSGPHETIDLDEMTYEAGPGTYTRDCERCGRRAGYVLHERELESEIEAEHHADGIGAIGIECGGCSLVIQVEFAILTQDGP